MEEWREKGKKKEPEMETPALEITPWLSGSKGRTKQKGKRK